MLVIASVDRKCEMEGAPKGQAAQYITDSHLVSVKPSNYYWNKVHKGLLIWISNTDKPPKNWYKDFHPVQKKRIVEHIVAEAKKLQAKKEKEAKEKKDKEAKAKKEKEAKAGK